MLPNPLVTGHMCLSQASKKSETCEEGLADPWHLISVKDFNGMTACSKSEFLMELFCDLSIHG